MGLLGFSILPSIHFWSHTGCFNSVEGMFVYSSSGYSVSNAALQPAYLLTIAYDAYFMSRRYAIVSNKGIIVLDPDE
jgi:hypothetical protein